MILWVCVEVYGMNDGLEYLYSMCVGVCFLCAYGCICVCIK